MSKDQRSTPITATGQVIQPALRIELESLPEDDYVRLFGLFPDNDRGPLWSIDVCYYLPIRGETFGVVETKQSDKLGDLRKINQECTQSHWLTSFGDESTNILTCLQYFFEDYNHGKGLGLFQSPPRSVQTEMHDSVQKRGIHQDGARLDLAAKRLGFCMLAVTSWQETIWFHGGLTSCC